MVRAFAVLVALSAWHAASASTLPITDRTLVGSWDFAAMDSTHTLTLAADHTFASSAWSGGERFVEARGTWRLIGHDLIRHVTWSIAERLRITERGVKMPPAHIREIIARVTHDTLAFRSGVTYKRGKAPPRPNHLTMRWSERLAAVVPHLP